MRSCHGSRFSLFVSSVVAVAYFASSNGKNIQYSSNDMKREYSYVASLMLNCLLDLGKKNSSVFADTFQV